MESGPRSALDTSAINNSILGPKFKDKRIIDQSVPYVTVSPSYDAKLETGNIQLSTPTQKLVSVESHLIKAFQQFCTKCTISTVLRKGKIVPRHGPGSILIKVAHDLMSSDFQSVFALRFISVWTIVE